MVNSSQGVFEHHGPNSIFRGASMCLLPQGHPVVFQAGDSDVGREFAAAEADCIFSRHGKLQAGQEFYRDVKKRLATYGRSPDDLKILPAATFVLGETGSGRRRSAPAHPHIRRQQVSGPTAILFLEQVWNRDPLFV